MKQLLAIILCLSVATSSIASADSRELEANFGLILTKNPKPLRKNKTKSYLSAKTYFNPDLKAPSKNKKKAATDKAAKQAKLDKLPTQSPIKRVKPETAVPLISKETAAATSDIREQSDISANDDINYVDLSAPEVPETKQYLLSDIEQETESSQSVFFVSADSSTTTPLESNVPEKNINEITAPSEDLLELPPQTNAPVMDPSIAAPPLATDEPLDLDTDKDLSETQVNIVDTPRSSLTTVVDAPVSHRENGFRLSVLKPVLDLTVTTQIKDSFAEPKQAQNKLESSGVAIGYAYLKERSLGGTINAALLQVTDETSATLGRIDGNLGVAFNKYVDIKAGLNGSKFLSGNKITNLMPQLGYQASMGIKVYENFGLDVGVTEMTQMGEVENMGTVIIMQTQQRGMEVGLNATF